MNEFLLGLALGWPIGVVVTWLVWDLWITPPLREIARDYLAHLHRDQELLLKQNEAHH